MARKSIIFKVFLLLALWSGTASAALFNARGALNASNPLLVPAFSQCVMLGKRSGREILVNRCGSCQIVKLSRKRPGSEPAIHRTYTVPAKSKTDLSFRGPGQTRITSSRPCRPKAPKAAQSEAEGKKCAQFQRATDGGLIIINTCNGCREILTERIGAGNYSAKQSFIIAGKAYVPMKAKGGSQARILAERKCGR